ncbi:MAG TPA: cytochrome c oxidase subunit 4 [Acidimicrobiales bacterium]
MSATGSGSHAAGRSGAGGSVTLKAEYLIFGGIGLAVLAWGVVYWLTSYEDAGTVMLLLAAALLLSTAAYLFVQHRRLAAPADEGDEAVLEPWFPHASIWPFGMGFAGFLLANGLVLGVWFVIPGVLVLAASTLGYARESRRRR